MRSQRISADGAATTYLLVFETGDEVLATLRDFARRESLHVCRFSAIGALSDLVLGYFEVAQREYRRIPVAEQVEVLSLVGTISE